MARVTVEDCIDKVTNRFELVLLASHRARTLSAGSDLRVERDNDKNPVVALREIAENALSVDEIRDSLIGQLQRFLPQEEAEEDRKVLAIEASQTEPEMSEETLLRALQSEKDSAGDNKL